jgi:hypothetical protein
MIRRAFVILAVILLSIIVVRPAPGFDLTVKKPVKVIDQQIPTILSNQKAFKSGNRLMQSPGTIIDSTYWDWQRNGGMDDHIVIFDDSGTIKINATMMAAYLEDTSDRMMRHYHWSGATWSGHGATVFPVRNGFGSMSQFPEGNPVFCTHGDVDGFGMRAYGAYEVFPGIGSFSFHGTSVDTVQLWPRITVNSDGSWVITGSGLTIYGIENSASWARSPNRVSPFSGWRFFNDIAPDWIGDDMEWPTIHSGTNGKVGVVIPDYGGSVRLFESTDNGETFDVITIAPADTVNLPAGLDSTAARLGWINSDIMYIGDDPHIVWSAGQGVNVGGEYGLLDFKSTIFHWSHSTGIDTVVVASTQSADPSRDDYVPTPLNHLSVDWPSIGLAVDGRTLVVAYTAFNIDDIDSTTIGSPLGYVDIWITTSSDNGETWTEPQNVTNPEGSILGWDDRYPSIAKINLNNTADPGKDVYMIYQSDPQAGSNFVPPFQEFALAYIKFVGIDLATVGIGDGGDGGSAANIPKVFSLSQNYPNPFNPSTTIRYNIPEVSNAIPVKVFVYDIRGRMVRILVDEDKLSGTYQVHWDGRDKHGQQVSSGVYLYRLEVGNFTSIRKMILVR